MSFRPKGEITPDDRQRFSFDCGVSSVISPFGRNDKIKQIKSVLICVFARRICVIRVQYCCQFLSSFLRRFLLRRNDINAWNYVAQSQKPDRFLKPVGFGVKKNFLFNTQSCHFDRREKSHAGFGKRLTILIASRSSTVIRRVCHFEEREITRWIR